MAKNNNLHKAKNSKNDEFYTLLEDIEKEIRYYTEALQDKIIYCPCDDYRTSNFVVYFKENFYHLKLKKLVATNYDIGNGAYKYEFDGKNEIITELNGDGDFRSEECIEYLKQADVVVTNPPFSLFREYVKQLMDYNKKFIIIGNKNAISYKEIFPYIKNNQLWLGASITSGDREFLVPKEYVTYSNSLHFDEKGNKYLRIPGVCWFTNVNNVLRNTPIDLYKKYNPTDYPKYDNYDAIEVSKTCDIPMDYDGIMGVPITFLFKYNPNQFEIIDINPHFYTFTEKGLPKPKQLSLNNVGKKDPYARVLIKILA